MGAKPSKWCVVAMLPRHHATPPETQPDAPNFNPSEYVKIYLFFQTKIPIWKLEDKYWSIFAGRNSSQWAAQGVGR